MSEQKPPYVALAHDIWRIDTAYVRPGLAACYLLRDGDEFALIECGTGLSVEPIIQALDDIGVPAGAVKFVIPTHVHLDHAGGAGGLIRALPNAHVYVHPRGARHLIDPGRLLAGAQAVYGEAEFRRLNGEILPVPAERCHEASDGAALPLGGRELLLLDAPGHARHHLVVWDAHSQGFFTGDVFGLCYPELETQGRSFIVPTTTPVQFDPEAWQQTLDRLASYAPQRMYLTHYGCVEEVETLLDELRLRVAEHARLGQRWAADGQELLCEKLSVSLFADYQSQGGGLDRRDFSALLEMDLKLNAQGLAHWQERLSSR